LTDEGAPARRPPRRLLGGARTRILAAILLLLAFSTVVSTVALRQLLLGRVDSRVDRELGQEVEEFRRLASSDPQTAGQDPERLFRSYLNRNVPARGEAVFTFVSGGGSSGQATQDDIARLRPLFDLRTTRTTRRGTRRTGLGDVRYLAVPVVVGGRRRGVFLVTSRLDEEREEVDAAVQVAGGVSVGVLILASLIAFLTVGRVLAPLRVLRDTAHQITETDLTRRIAVDGRDEIAELGHTFNDMLDRLERAFAGQKAFVSDAGHELRTPITIIRGHLELLGDDPHERRETIELVTDELDRMSRFVDDLLLLAKAEHGDFLHLADVDLDVLTEELLAKAVALADRDWRLDAAGTGRLTADRQRLTQAIMQLAANAAQHTQPGDPIGLGTALQDGTVRLWVSDSGPGVPPGDEERIFERFARGTNGRRRSEGAGLGLSIVRAIAEGHGGRVELGGPRAGSETGATFTLIVPATPPEEPEGT
jgi:signal transduction histidine kinase